MAFWCPTSLGRHWGLTTLCECSCCCTATRLSELAYLESSMLQLIQKYMTGKFVCL